MNREMKRSNYVTREKLHLSEHFLTLESQKCARIEIPFRALTLEPALMLGLREKMVSRVEKKGESTS